MTRRTLSIVAAIAMICSTIAADAQEPDRTRFSLRPTQVRLTRPGAEHRLLAGWSNRGQWLGAATDPVKFTSSDPNVAMVDEAGVIRALTDGEATITATSGEHRAGAKVIVSGAAEPFEWSFRNHIQPVLFKSGCNAGACHGAAAGKNGFKLSLRGFDHEKDHMALTRQANGRRVSLADPANSLMLLKPTADVPHEGGERFEAGSESHKMLLDWVRAGAPGPKAEDPIIESIDIFPRDMKLGLGADQQLLVRAHYDNGTYEDVTSWVKFGTTDESVAQVDEEGRATVNGPGAASLTAWYSSKVASVRLTVPRANEIDEKVFAEAQSNNMIDELVLKQLRSLQIAPAESATDAEFIRRAYIDALGVLPEPGEALGFGLDGREDKRARLIDSLLEREEFTDYWAYKWSDLLLLSSRNLPRREELSSFYRFIRSSVEENKPWDDFVREIVTAKGSTLENGAAGYYVMHKETIDLTETTSQAFLGMSVTCARCHNHPLEKWTQDDYYGFANLMSRVKLKNGRAGNDTDVIAAEFGDIIHPRTGAPMPPKPLDGEAISLRATEDRREVLADWLTSPENPYFTRAIVNRVWRNFMGRGLVEPEDDLRLTNPASNDELLGALAKELVEHDYDLKSLIRSIMNSATYQRSSRPSDPEAPDEKYYSQYIIRRMTAEVMLDAYSQVSGVPTKFSGYPAGFRALQLPDSQVGSYFLQAFGRPERKQVCSCERTEDLSIAQALHVSNGDTLNKKLSDERSIIRELVKDGRTDAEAIDRIYVRALSRRAWPEEREQASEILAEMAREGEGWEAERREALEDLAWAVLSGKEFTFNH